MTKRKSTVEVESMPAAAAVVRGTFPTRLHTGMQEQIRSLLDGENSCSSSGGRIVRLAERFPLQYRATASAEVRAQTLRGINEYRDFVINARIYRRRLTDARDAELPLISLDRRYGAQS